MTHPVFDYGTIVGGDDLGAPRARDGIGFVGGGAPGAPRARDGIGFVGGDDLGAASENYPPVSLSAATLPDKGGSKTYRQAFPP